MRPDAWVSHEWSERLLRNAALGVVEPPELSPALHVLQVALHVADIDGVSWPETVPRIRLGMPLRGFAPDYLTFGGHILVSRRLREALAQPAHVVQFVPVDLVRGGARARRQDYRLMRVLAKYPSVDRSSPLSVMKPVTSWLTGETEFWLDMLRPILLRRDFDPPEDIFRVAERPSQILVSDALAERVLRAGCTGVDFGDPGTVHWRPYIERTRTAAGICFRRIGFHDDDAPIAEGELAVARQASLAILRSVELKQYRDEELRALLEPATIKTRFWRLDEDPEAQQELDDRVWRRTSWGIVNREAIDGAWRAHRSASTSDEPRCDPWLVDLPPPRVVLPRLAVAHDYFSLDGYHFVSHRLREAMAQPSDVVQFLPIELSGGAKLSQAMDYRLMHVRAHHCGVDFERSPGEVYGPRDPVTGEQRKRLSSGGPFALRADFDPPEELFCLADYIGFHFVTAALADRILRAGCTGLLLADPAGSCSAFGPGPRRYRALDGIIDRDGWQPGVSRPV
jgi:hypothetical protein